MFHLSVERMSNQRLVTINDWSEGQDSKMPSVEIYSTLNIMIRIFCVLLQLFYPI